MAKRGTYMGRSRFSSKTNEFFQVKNPNAVGVGEVIKGIRPQTRPGRTEKGTFTIVLIRL